jgi:hypothetical protein
MITNEVDALTLQYFINNKFDKIITADKQGTVISSTERKFYRKRIMQLTKDIFKNKPPNDAIQSSFNNFAHSCISYFKFTDASDLLQEEYDNIEVPVTSDTSVIDMNAVDEVLFNIPSTANTLDNFVTNKTVTLDKKILPKSRLLNITTDKFRTKGIKKKKKKENIENIYDEEQTPKDGGCHEVGDTK